MSESSDPDIEAEYRDYGTLPVEEGAHVHGVHSRASWGAMGTRLLSVGRDGRTVTVTCAGQAGSGKTNENTDLNTPAHALLRLSTNSDWLFGEDGILQQSNGKVAVRGSVYSNTTIETEGSKAQLAGDGPVAA